MSWATLHIERLRLGETVSFRPRGRSMEPRIYSGQLCTVEPIADAATLQPKDIVLCHVEGNDYLHLIESISATATGPFRSRTIEAA